MRLRVKEKEGGGFHIRVEMNDGASIQPIKSQHHVISTSPGYTQRKYTK